MPMKKVFLTLLFLGLTAPESEVRAQNPSEINQVLSSAVKAFAEGQSVSLVSLTGEVRLIEGPSDETGQAVLIARSNGSSTAQFDFGAEHRTESQDITAGSRQCSWSGRDAVTHAGAAHNCMLTTAWSLPMVSLSAGTSFREGAFLASDHQEEGQVSLHWAVLTPSSTTPAQAELLANLGSYDLEFDESTFLPVALTYAVHPDLNAGIDIPVRIEYSNYRSVDGAALPFHIQRYLNGTLSMDITITSAVVTH